MKSKVYSELQLKSFKRVHHAPTPQNNPPKFDINVDPRASDICSRSVRTLVNSLSHKTMEIQAKQLQSTTSESWKLTKATD